MKTKTYLLLFALLAFSATTHAQATGSGTTASGTNAPANRTDGPESTSGIGKDANWDQMTMQGRSGNQYGGRVINPNGLLPWEPIRVVVSCNGSQRYSTYTDSKGNFLIAPSNPTASLGADVPGKPSSASALVGCDIRAVFPGYNSSTLLIADRSMLDNPDLGTIKLIPEAGSQDAALSATGSSVPKDARKEFEKARSEWIDKKPDRAEKDLEKAVHEDPQFAEAWYQLGKIQQASDPQGAWNSFTKAVAADPKFSLPYSHLAAMAAQQSKWQEVLDNTAKQLQLDPEGSPEIWYFNALGNFKLDKKDVAEASARKAVAMDPLHTQPNSEQLLAVILADKHDFAGALEHLRNCVKYLPPGPNTSLVEQQIAQLEKMVPASK